MQTKKLCYRCRALNLERCDFGYPVEMTLERGDVLYEWEFEPSLAELDAVCRKLLASRR